MKYIFSQKRTKIILVFIWLVGFLISLPFIKMVEYSTNPNQCQLSADLKDIVYILSYNIIVLFLPAIALTVLYIFIIIKLKKRNRNFFTVIRLEKYSKSYTSSRGTIDSLYSNNRLDSSSQNIEDRLSFNKDLSCKKISILSRSSLSIQKSNLTIIFLIMAIVFFCCQLPVRIFQCWSYLHFYSSFKNESEIEPLSELELKIVNIISQASSLIYFMHCVSNPIIYNIQSTKFRSSLCFKMVKKP